MKIKTIISLVSCYVISQAIVAQEFGLQRCKFYKEIATEDRDKKERVYLEFSEIDSAGNQAILLINNTPDSIITSGFYKQPIAKAQFKINGYWKEPYYHDGCATGYGHFVMPKYTFTCASKFDLTNYHGNYETEARFYIYTLDSAIISKSFSLSVDTILVLHRENAILERINNELNENPNLSSKKRLSVLCQKAKWQASFQRPKEAITTFEELVNTYPEHYEGIYEYGRFLMKQATKRTTSHTIDKKAMLQKAMQKFEKIPRHDKLYKRAAIYREAIVKELKNYQ